MGQMKRVVPIAILVIILLVLASLFFRRGPQMQEQLGLKQTSEALPPKSAGMVDKSYVSGDNLTYNNSIPMNIDTNKTYQAVLHTTEGDIVVSLNAQATPITVNNFVTLAEKNFYNNTIFHRVIKGFMIQGGDPKGDGTGDPGYKFADEPFTGDYTRGTVAMANSGPDTNGSQFFIMHADAELPKNYVIFGTVTSGLEVVDKIAEAPVEISRSGERSQPVTPVRVTSVTIEEK